MVTLCEVCRQKIATASVQGVKLCRDCFDALRAKKDLTFGESTRSW